MTDPPPLSPHACSGVTFGFVANNASWQLPELNDYADYTQAYDTEMGDLTRAEPFPDILSLSWGAHFLVPDTAREATMAKYASMGMTVLAASGDTGEWTGQIDMWGGEHGYDGAGRIRRHR